MKALLQRVSKGFVSIDGQVVGEIGAGLVILLGIHGDDTRADVDYVADKCVNLRIFNDDDGKMNRSLLDAGGGALIISQFTLYGDTRKGRRPSFTDAARPETAIPLYEAFIERVESHGAYVATGRFGANMQVEIHNDGPVTLEVISKP
jgi:D-tyrosyl-tRNA(Tyr) deacylase